MENISKQVASVVGKIGNGANAVEGDFRGEDGLLRCGACGQKKETIVRIKTVGGEVKKRVGCLCRCEEEKRRLKESEEARRAAEDRVRSMKKASLMDERLSNARFSCAEETKFNRKNLMICRKYVDMFPEMVRKKQGLLFWGDVGTGKSYAAACIANAVMDMGIPVVMTSFVKAVDLYRTKEQEESIIKLLATAKLVIFDDLGAERATEFAIEKVYDIIDSRYRSGLPMIVTTNMTLNEMLAEKDLRYSRIYDRIFEMCYPMQWTGPSWRKVRAGSRFEEMGGLFV